MPITLPTIHRNGTGASVLTADYLAATIALRNALDVIAKIEFNQRDYYPVGVGRAYRPPARADLYRPAAQPDPRRVGCLVELLRVSVSHQRPENRVSLPPHRRTHHPMSYTIERKPTVFSFTFPAADDIYNRHQTLFAAEHGSSNVFPTDWSWFVLGAQEAESSDGSPRRWNGEYLLPERLWENAHEADGGGIKRVRDHDISGLDYLRQWKALAAKPKPFDFSLGWCLSFWSEANVNTLPLKPGVYEPERLTGWLAQFNWQARMGYAQLRHAAIPDDAALGLALRIWARRRDFIPNEYGCCPLHIRTMG